MTGHDQPKQTQEPEWMAPFLAALRAEPKIRAAARAAGVPMSTAYGWRRRDPSFAREWAEACSDSAAEAQPGWGGARRTSAKKIDRFIDALAESSNVRAAAKTAGIEARTIYRLRRSDPDFARRWYAALAEGYDNLEMEMLEHLRAASEGSAGCAGARKFDSATALRCLTAHRENVAREKGRRALADEVTTIASINAKIDALRGRARENERAIRKSRKKAARNGNG